MAFRKLAERLKMAGPLDVTPQFLYGLPGTPFAIRGGDGHEDRLPGMRRWVDRAMLQRALQGQDQGMSLDEYLSREDRHSLTRKIIGGGTIGGIGGMAIANSHGRAPLASAIMGLLAGAGVGAGMHLGTADSRDDAAVEAYLGAQEEVAKYPRPRSALPQGRFDESSAYAVPPTLLHTGPSVAR